MTDLEKVKLWNKVCAQAGFEDDLDSWISDSDIIFTPNGSAVSGKIVMYTPKRMNAIIGEIIKMGSNPEDVVMTLVLEASVGMIVFGTREDELVFWDDIIEKSKVIGLTIPKIFYKID